MLPFSLPHQTKNPETLTNNAFQDLRSGELGIRTPGPVTVNSFQDCRNRPLCQLSGAKVRFKLFRPKTFRYLFAPGLCPLPLPNLLSQQ